MASNTNVHKLRFIISMAVITTVMKYQSMIPYRHLVNNNTKDMSTMIEFSDGMPRP